MNRFVFFSTALLLILSLATESARAEQNPLDENARQSLESAIRSVDEGNIDVGISMLETLLSLYPDNYVVRYELAFAHLRAEDNELALETSLPLLNHPDATPMVYSIVGSCYDYLGQSEKAIETYALGLDRFPRSGLLHVEKGITAYRNSDFQLALDHYEKAIEVAPRYDAGYYRASKLYRSSTAPVVGLLYAEAHILLSNRRDRNSEMSNLIKEILEDHIKIGGDSIKITLVGNRTITENMSPRERFLLGLELGYALGCSALKNGYTLSSVTEMRGVALDLLLETFAPDNRMALQRFQKAVKDAGHWDAYNVLVLGPAFPEDTENWFANPDNEEKFSAFAEWFRNYPEEIIGDENTVSIRLF